MPENAAEQRSPTDYAWNDQERHDFLDGRISRSGAQWRSKRNRSPNAGVSRQSVIVGGIVQRLALFDLDNTLVNLDEGVVQIWAEKFAEEHDLGRETIDWLVALDRV
ncbi:hypothetical protein FHR32_003325 [Streptosporangium album]|uniref:Uncharacterized protein n=1 Tax=Streptosporangium album TaxID=47479 RepID=A0A7W7RVL7_9ACTN|nr:hypothetical protein [Streptosporangium album]MBB4939020.1 hypothetical protein [Streptosporangium album]